MSSQTGNAREQKSPGSGPDGESAPRLRHVTCAHPGGLHRMAIAEWGDPASQRVVVCVHGLTRNGRDFDRLAQALARDGWRVLCPDMPGRGRSDWHTDPALYAIPHYVADCVTLVARADVEQVAWVGTSMGGLIGMVLASLEGNPINRFVINDVGPVVAPAGMKRIATYTGVDTSGFDTYEAGVDYVARVSAAFGRLDRSGWDLLARHTIVPDGQGRWKLHYDPMISAGTRLMASAPMPDLWPLWERIRVPTLLLRGADSDLLDEATASAMTTRGPRAQRIDYVEVGHAPSLVVDPQIEDVRRFLAG